jgi:hypothetical protein
MANEAQDPMPVKISGQIYLTPDEIITRDKFSQKLA